MIVGSFISQQCRQNGIDPVQRCMKDTVEEFGNIRVMILVERSMSNRLERSDVDNDQRHSCDQIGLTIPLFGLIQSLISYPFKETHVKHIKDPGTVRIRFVLKVEVEIKCHYDALQVPRKLGRITDTSNDQKDALDSQGHADGMEDPIDTISMTFAKLGISVCGGMGVGKENGKKDDGADLTQQWRWKAQVVLVRGFFSF